MGQVTVLATILSKLCKYCTLCFCGTQLICCCHGLLLSTNQFLRGAMQAAMKLLFIHSFYRNSSGSFPCNKCTWCNKCSVINLPTGFSIATPFCTLPKLVLSLWHHLPTLDREMLDDSKVILTLTFITVISLKKNIVSFRCGASIFNA